MRIFITIFAATLLFASSCNRYMAHVDEQQRWLQRDYQPVAATEENGGLRAIDVADSVMVSLGYELSEHTSVLSFDSSTFRVEYSWRETGDGGRLMTGGGIVAYISRADFAVLQFYLYQ